MSSQSDSKKSDWNRQFKNVIEKYYQHRMSDPFMEWFRRKDKEGAFSDAFERVLVILIDARFDQQTTAEKALENTIRVHQAGALKHDLRRSDIPILIPRQRAISDDWTYLFYVALPKLRRLAYHIGSRRNWTAAQLLKVMSQEFRVPYLGVKTSRLAVRWLHELVPSLSIDMSDFKVPVDSLLYRVAARLEIVDPYTEKYYGERSPADLKIQKFAKELFPYNPGLLDEPLWSTGRQQKSGGHCFPKNPLCQGCIFEGICPKKNMEIDPSKIRIIANETQTERQPPRARRRSTHAQLIREAVTELGQATPRQIMDYIQQRHPEVEVKPASFRADIIGCSVNHTSSHHYPGMPKFLFYDQQKGTYKINELADAQI